MLINDKEYLNVLYNICEYIRIMQYQVVLEANLSLMYRNWKIDDFLSVFPIYLV